MSILVGQVYKFSFLETEGYDGLNGIYRLRSQLDYKGVIVEGGDLFTNLYEHAGKTAEDLAVDLAANPSKIHNEVFLKLEAITNIVLNNGPTPTAIHKGAFIYVPTRLLAGLPQGDIKEYAKIALNVDLGVFADPNHIVMLQTSVEEVIEGAQGILSKAQISIYDSVWLTTPEYEALEIARATGRNNYLVTHPLGKVNYYTELQKSIFTNIGLQARVAELETLVVALHTQLNQP